MKTALELHEKWKLLWMKVDDYESMLKVVCHYLSGDWLPHNWAQHLLLEVRKMFNYNENLQSQWRRSITMSRLLVSDANSGLWCGSHRTTSWIHSASSSSCSGERWVPYYIILLPEFPFGPGCSSGNFWTAGQSRVWQAWPAELGCDHHCRHWALDLHQVWVRGKSSTFWLFYLLSDGRRSRSPYQGTLLYGGCLVPPSCWSTLSSSSTCSSPTMCRSLRRSTSGLGHPWVAQQVQATNSITYNDSFAYFRNPSEAQRSSWRGSSRFWGRWWGGRSSRASGQRSRRAGGQRGEEGQVKFKFWENGTIILFLGQVSQRFPDKSASTILKQNLCFILVEGRWKHF